MMMFGGLLMLPKRESNGKVVIADLNEKKKLQKLLFILFCSELWELDPRSHFL